MLWAVRVESGGYPLSLTLTFVLFPLHWGLSALPAHGNQLGALADMDALVRPQTNYKSESLGAEPRHKYF